MVFGKLNINHAVDLGTTCPAHVRTAAAAPPHNRHAAVCSLPAIEMAERSMDKKA